MVHTVFPDAIVVFTNRVNFCLAVLKAHYTTCLLMEILSKEENSQKFSFHYTANILFRTSWPSSCECRTRSLHFTALFAFLPRWLLTLSKWERSHHRAHIERGLWITWPWPYTECNWSDIYLFDISYKLKMTNQSPEEHNLDKLCRHNHCAKLLVDGGTVIWELSEMNGLVKIAMNSQGKIWIFEGQYELLPLIWASAYLFEGRFTLGLGLVHCVALVLISL